jgi:hypothetical protein
MFRKDSNDAGAIVQWRLMRLYKSVGTLAKVFTSLRPKPALAKAFGATSPLGCPSNSGARPVQFGGDENAVCGLFVLVDTSGLRLAIDFFVGLRGYLDR